MRKEILQKYYKYKIKINRVAGKTHKIHVMVTENGVKTVIKLTKWEKGAKIKNCNKGRKYYLNITFEKYSMLIPMMSVQKPEIR